MVAPYKKYLLERWNSGCHDTKKLYAEIQQQGYKGSYVTLARYTHRLRNAQGFKPRQKAPQSLPLVFEPQKSLTKYSFSLKSDRALLLVAFSPFYLSKP
ncbi:MAG: hypothetical protein AAGA16_19510 [Cyanobacteria bacterium P01_E01_bin.35]